MKKNGRKKEGGNKEGWKKGGKEEGKNFCTGFTYYTGYVMLNLESRLYFMNQYPHLRSVILFFVFSNYIFLVI